MRVDSRLGGGKEGSEMEGVGGAVWQSRAMRRINSAREGKRKRGLEEREGERKGRDKIERESKERLGWQQGRDEGLREGCKAGEGEEGCEGKGKGMEVVDEVSGREMWRGGERGVGGPFIAPPGVEWKVCEGGFWRAAP